MAVDALSGAASATASSSLGNSRQSIAENFDTFLTLLTTQLKNQNPLDPLDTNQFTSQLVQFTSVEQQLKTNEFLEALVQAGSDPLQGSAASANQAISLIGKTVVANNSRSELANGQADWTFTLPGSTGEAEISVRNANGDVVYTEKRPLSSGQNTFSWNGKDNAGLDLERGTYALSVNARDAQGQAMQALAQSKGRVTSVDLTGQMPMLVAGGARIPLDAVLSVMAE